MLAAMGNVFSWLWQLEMSEAKALIILFRTTSQAVFCVRQNVLATLGVLCYLDERTPDLATPIHVTVFY